MQVADVVDALDGTGAELVGGADHQQTTHEWWNKRRSVFDVVASELVAREAGAGDPQAAQERLAVLATIPLLDVKEEARSLAKELVILGAVPPEAAEDALHIAIAATSGVDYLLTWNLRHMANATMRTRIEEVCRLSGYRPVVICTPDALLED